jgi:hypothetical protein
MKQLLGLLTLSMIISACDAPVRTRVPTTGSFSSGGVTQGQPGYVDPGTGSNTTGTTTGSQGNNVIQEPGFENCDLSLSFSGGSLGYFGLCKHTSDERRYKAVFAQSNTAGTCFVPVHKQSSGSSYKLGIAECVHNQANTNYYMTLNKEMMPPTFSYPRPEAINAVMVIKASSVNAYMGCMNAKNDFFVGTQGCCYQSVPFQGRIHCVNPNPQCEAPANNYANTVCSTFVQNHSNHYRQVSF